MATPRLSFALTTLCLALLTSIGASDTRADDIDKTSIIRSLAPIRYLPQHSGQDLSSRRALDLNIEFTTGSAKLTARARRQLDVVARALQDQQLRYEQFHIIGHTDATGPARLNQDLSSRRAQAVQNYLVQQGRVHPARLKSRGEGESHLKNPMAPASGENRRVEFVLIQSPGQPASGQNKTGREKVIKW